MATVIILKKSSTTGGAPLAGDLNQGELALNLADRKIYTKDNGNAVVLLGTVYVDSTEPPSPAEGDPWYDQTTNTLKVHNGSGFDSYAKEGHTHSASDISDFDTEVSNNAAVAANTAKTGNATHTGEVTGSGALTIASNVVDADNLKVTGNGTTSQYLRSDGDGTFSWATPPDTDTNTTYSNGTGVALVGTTFSIGQEVGTGSDVTFNSATVGDLTVTGTLNAVSSNEVNIGDGIIVLNADEVGVPSQNAGFTIERGTSANVSVLWDESADAWTFGDETVQGMIIDGGSF